MTNPYAKAGVATGGALLTVGAGMLTTPATVLPGAIILGVGALLTFASALQHEPVRRSTDAGPGQVADDEDPK